MVLMVCDHRAVSYTPITAIFGSLTSSTPIKVAYYVVCEVPPSIQNQPAGVAYSATMLLRGMWGGGRASWGGLEGGVAPLVDVSVYETILVDVGSTRGTHPTSKLSSEFGAQTSYGRSE